MHRGISLAAWPLPCYNTLGSDAQALTRKGTAKIGMEGDPLQQRPTLVDRFMDRLQRDQSFRNTMSVLGIALALMVVCGTTLVADNVVTQMVSGIGFNATKYHVNIGNAGDNPTYPVATPAPASTLDPSQLTGGTPVATVTFSPSPTPVATPMGTPTPAPRSTPAPGTFTVSANTSPSPWIAGQTGTIDSIATSPPQRGAQMVILLQFGNDPTCTATLTVQLQHDGTDPNTETVNIPSCVTAQVTVQATFTIAGQASYVDPNFATAGP